jgi:formylglycine-generating enzyme
MKPIFLILAFLSSLHIFAQNNAPRNMILIPKGEFNMGKNTPNPTDWQPEHLVTIDSFYLDQYEVSNQQYAEFCRATKHALPEFWGSKEFKCGMDFPDFPVVGVSWFDADSYAKWAGKRLLTEAEWEYASRGGLVNQNFPSGNQIDSTKVNYSKKYKGTLRCGSFPPNNFGVYDMAGNVWEWTSDNYASDYYQASPGSNPKGPERGRFKVIRGGSWHSGAMCVQNYFRNGLSPSWVDFAVGFRCAKNIELSNN